jgi:hypothetical protein
VPLLRERHPTERWLYLFSVLSITSSAWDRQVERIVRGTEKEAAAHREGGGLDLGKCLGSTLGTLGVLVSSARVSCLMGESRLFRVLTVLAPVAGGGWVY